MSQPTTFYTDKRLSPAYKFEHNIVALNSLYLSYILLSSRVLNAPTIKDRANTYVFQAQTKQLNIIMLFALFYPNCLCVTSGLFRDL